MKQSFNKNDKTTITPTQKVIEISLESRQNVACDMSSSNKTLVVSFAGKRGAKAFPSFEFIETLANIDVKKIFLRDLDEAWYHIGLNPLLQSFKGGGVDHNCSYLNGLFDSSDINKKIFIGNSAGGYAALLFGYLLQADEVHAFAPKTFLNPFRRINHGERRIWRKILGIYRVKSRQSKYFDLRRVFNQKHFSGEVGNKKNNFHIYYGLGTNIDRWHAENMRGAHNVVLHGYDFNRHILIKKLKADGQLQKIFATFVS